MSYHRNYRDAARNVSQSKGWMCPTCNCLVPRGYEVCYNCGEMPIEGDTSYASVSDGEVGCIVESFFFGAIFISPLFYYLTSLQNYDLRIIFNVLVFIPNLIILISTIVSLKNRGKSFGWIFTPVRLWVLIFSALAFINSIKFFIDY